MNLGLQQQQQDENEILSISHIHGEIGANVERL